jgi:Tfp pilus assembly protein PilV
MSAPAQRSPLWARLIAGAVLLAVLAALVLLGAIVLGYLYGQARKVWS